MKNRNCLGSVAAIIIVMVSLIMAGCSLKKEETPPPAPVYGVADLETLVKAHPKYSEYFKLETEYNHLLDQYQNERKRLIAISAQQAKIKQAMQDQSVQLAAENELKTKVKMKEDELNKGLAGLYSEISAAHNKSGETSFEGLTPEERAEMANLQMKLTVLGVSGSEKDKVKARLEELIDARIQREKNDMTGWTPEEVKRMQDAKKAAESQLESYAASTAAEIKKELAEKYSNGVSDSAIANLPNNEEWNNGWNARIDAKQKQMAAVKAEIMADIQKDAGRVASEKNLTMIFSKYKANVSAVDVTSDILGKIINENG